MDNFIKINLSSRNSDIYFIRKSIFDAIKKNLKKFNGNLLDFGCGRMPYREYILRESQVKKYVGLDISGALIYDKDIEPDFMWDGLKMPFDDGTFETVIGTEVLEHCPDPVLTLKEVYRVTKKGGVFFFTVPFLWPLHESPHDEYRYTPYALERIFNEVGFKDIEICIGGGWHASMAQMLGLWAKRAPLKAWKRYLLLIIVKPLIKFLIKKDCEIDHTVKDQQMFTNLYGTAKK